MCLILIQQLKIWARKVKKISLIWKQEMKLRVRKRRKLKRSRQLVCLSLILHLRNWVRKMKTKSTIWNQERKIGFRKEAGKKRRVLETSDSEGMESRRDKKRKKKSGDFDELPISTASMNMTKKERREHLDQLRAKNQRLLHETREAAFEPAPLVRKPISSVLEKIRRRKEEISKQFLSRKKSKHVDIYNEDGNDSEEVVAKEKNEDMDTKITSKKNRGGKHCLEESAGPSGNSDSHSTKKAECNPIHKANQLMCRNFRSLHK